MLVDVKEMGHKYFKMVHNKDIDSMSFAKIWHHNREIEVLVTCDTKGITHVLDLESKEKIDIFGLHNNYIKDIKYLGENLFASGSKDGTVIVWKYGCD